MSEPAWDGVPPNPEQDGWHWLLPSRGGNRDPIPFEWIAEDDGAWGTDDFSGISCPEDMAKQFAYAGPCLTPAEILTLRSERDAARAALRALYDACEYRANREGGDFGPEIGPAAELADAALAASAREGE